ncbi:hypothetical protein [Staphylococcus haemolyticus]|uniref:hypothetical protein n=1 Tax=Staphylococcus haemolyticus TaxID=1283 RepID=UPI00066D7080
MEWFQLIAIAILSILWAISTYKWVSAEKQVKELVSKNTELIDDRKRLQRKLVEMEDKDNKCNIGKYVVELNNEVYLVKKYINSYRNTCIITDNIFEALSYDDLFSAKEDARNFNGRVLEHKPNLEVVK